MSFNFTSTLTPFDFKLWKYFFNSSGFIEFWNGYPNAGGSTLGSPTSFGFIKNISGSAIRLQVSYFLSLPFSGGCTKLMYKSIGFVNGALPVQCCQTTTADSVMGAYSIGDAWHNASFTAIVPNTSNLSITGTLITNNAASLFMAHQGLDIQMLPM